MKKYIRILFICFIGAFLYFNREDISLRIKGYEYKDRVYILGLDLEEKEEYLDTDKIDFSKWDIYENDGHYMDYEMYPDTNEEESIIVEKVDFYYANIDTFEQLGYFKEDMRKEIHKYSIQDLVIIASYQLPKEDVDTYQEIPNRVLEDIPLYKESGLEPLVAVSQVSYPFIDSRNYSKNVYTIVDTNREDILVKKGFALSADYVPDSLMDPGLISDGSNVLLSKNAALALQQMADTMAQENLTLGIRSAYRSYEEQLLVYNYYLEENGQAYVDQYVAIPGFSEHQTGLAVDLTSGSVIYGELSSFDQSGEYVWVCNHAHEYGFILRYPEFKSDITGTSTEPWHFRYVGKELATYLYEHNLALEEYILENGISYTLQGGE